MRISRASKLAALVLLSACAESVQPPAQVAQVLTAPSRIIRENGTFAVLTPMQLGRVDPVAVAMTGKLYVIGGQAPGARTGVVERYDPVTDSWVYRTALPNPRVKPAVAALDGTLFVLGGLGAVGNAPVADVYVSNDGAKTWSSGNPLPFARTDARAAVVDGKIYVIGGSNSGQYVLRVDVYDPGANAWAQAAAFPYNCGGVTALNTVGHTIYVNFANCAMALLDVDGNSWTIPGASSPLTGSESSGVVDDRIYVFSAGDGSSNSAYGFEPATGSWIDVGTPTTGTLAHFSGSAAIAGVIYSVGGLDLAGSVYGTKLSSFRPAFAGNLAPTVNLNGPYRGVEGTGVVFDAGAVDPEGETLTYAWTFGDGVTSTDASPTHAFDDDGEYAVTVKVTDPEGRSRVGSTRTVIRNVRPTVSGIEGATVHLPSAYIATGTITDPGDEVFTATVDWGAGAGPAPHAVTGNSISLNHVYASPGSYNIVVKISDGDGGSVTVSRWIRVRPGGS